jgi:cellulose synthase/poly-beta-1,6-N-acetylglucosamine synthase-like glycosyltransferase
VQADAHSLTDGSVSEEVPLNWNKWVRQTHRWLSIAFTVAVIVNIVAVIQKKYTASVGLLAVVPLALQFFTGLYLFVLPYATKWRSTQRN